MAQKREIQRNPFIPFLSDKAIRALNRLFFKREETVSKADLLFVFGTTRQAKSCADAVTNLLLKGISDIVLITGGSPDFDDKNNNMETRASSDVQRILKYLDKSFFPNTRFFHEYTSRNTLENVVNGLKVIDFSHFSYIAYITKGVHALRGYLTLKKFVSSHTYLSRHVYATTGRSGGIIDQHNWYASPEGVAYVWGEFERIRLYGDRGDIAFDEVRDEINYIQMLVN